MIPLSEIISRVRTRHEHSSATRWSDADIRDLVNEGLETLAEETGFYERYVTVPEQANRTWYDLRGFTPETVVRINSVWSSTRTEWLEATTEDRLQFDWEDSTGTPQRWFTRGINWLGVWPKLGSSDTAGYLRVYFNGLPPRLTYNQAVLYDLPDDYVPALEDYVLYEMASMDRDYNKALLHWGSYKVREKSLGDLRKRRLVANAPGRMGGLHVKYSG